MAFRGGQNYRQHTALKDYIKSRDNNTCQICGAGLEARLEVDHIIPYAISRDSRIDNLRTLCTRCNRETRRKRVDSKLSEKEYSEWLAEELAVFA